MSAIKTIERIRYKGAKSVPHQSRGGTSIKRKTGSWRAFKPVIDLGKCIRCRLCWIYCPESAVSLDRKDYPRIDYRVCKGCGICAAECPVKCIKMERDLHK